MIDLNDYYCGGYLLVKARVLEAWEYGARHLFPSKVISLSECIASVFKLYWAWESNRERDQIIAFGIDPQQITAFAEWCSSNPDIEYPQTFKNVQAARDLVKRFLLAVSDLHLIGVGVNKQDTSLPLLQLENMQHGRIGIDKNVYEKMVFEAGGVPLGFEIASYPGDHGFGHSWLCSGIEKDALDLFGIRPNEHGFIPTYAEAKQVHDWIAEDNMQGRRSEPEPYAPWLIVSYPLD